MTDKDTRFKTHTGLHETDPRNLRNDPPANVKRGCGRPSTYSLELAERVLEQIAEGRFLVDITKGPGLPTWRTIYRWADARSDFRQSLARAHEDGAHALLSKAERLLENATQHNIQVVREQVAHSRYGKQFVSAHPTSHTFHQFAGFSLARLARIALARVESGIMVLSAMQLFP